MPCPAELTMSVDLALRPSARAANRDAAIGSVKRVTSGRPRWWSRSVRRGPGRGALPRLLCFLTLDPRSLINEKPPLSPYSEKIRLALGLKGVS